MGRSRFKHDLKDWICSNLKTWCALQERSHLGLVRFRKQHMVPDVGGLGWRTKTGHLLKNQSYFPQTKVNTWDVPACAGVNTWQELLTNLGVVVQILNHPFGITQELQIFELR